MYQMVRGAHRRHLTNKMVQFFSGGGDAVLNQLLLPLVIL